MTNDGHAKSQVGNCVLSSCTCRWRVTFYFAVGITNSAPLPMFSGQRCMIDFCLV